MSRVVPVSDVQAMGALESIDDCARMGIGVAATGAYETLHEFIMQHSTTPGLADMSRAELDAGSARYTITAAGRAALAAKK